MKIHGRNREAEAEQGVVWPWVSRFPNWINFWNAAWRFGKNLLSLSGDNKHQNRQNMKQVGDRLPEILGRDQDGNEIKLSDFARHKLVLYIYPKDSTPGCTNEACNLRDNYHRFLAKGYAIVGASVQDEKSHRKFIEKYQLPFPLIADTEKWLVTELGVYGEKKMYGRTTMGTFRTTFVVNEEGIIERILGPKDIKVKEHAEQILG